jgi:alpha-glucoside transport system permease protein
VDAIRNSVIWLVLFTAMSVLFGLAFAVLFDRVRYEAVAKSIIFIPLAISFTAAAVIWRFMYDYRPPGVMQTGTLNAVLGVFRVDPVAWLVNSPLNTLALVVVGVWMWAGFNMVILSAGLKGMNPELLEAARVDGASEWRVFWHVTLPFLAPTLAVVTTLMVVVALKTFDIVYVMTNGSFDTNVIANDMYQELFSFGQPGRASAIAIVLLLAVLPVMVVNIRRFRAQEALR